MIRFRRSVEDSPLIDLTSMIDVVFLMLIYIMVSATFERVRDNPLRVELPKTTYQQGTGDVTPVVIAVDSASQVYWKEQKISLEDLELSLQTLPDLKSQTLLIQADEKTPHGTVIKIFDILNRNHIERFRIATERVTPTP